MTPFEEYTKDWKNITGSASSFNNDFLKQKNETIMKKLIKFEQEEKRNIFKGLTLGTLGIVLGLGFGVGLPVYHGIIELSPPIIIGSVIMFASILMFSVAGMFCIYYGLFGGFSANLLLFFLMPVFFSVVAYFIWSKAYAKTENEKIRPLIEEIEAMIAGLQNA